MFTLTISCITLLILEYNQYSKTITQTTQITAQKTKENIHINTTTQNQTTTLTATNHGQTPTLIKAILHLNPQTNNLTYQQLPQPLSLNVLNQKTLTLNTPTHENYTIGILTTYGNIFWQPPNHTQTTPQTPTPTLWLSDWQYRKSHTINPGTNADKGYQIKITTHYGHGTDNNQTVYLNNNSKPDFADIRFTTNDGQTQLNHWMKTHQHENYATFYININQNLSNTPKTIYIYYGNPNAQTTSNGQKTFPLFTNIIQNLQTQLGQIPLTTINTGQDPGDGFGQSTPIKNKYATPCIWFSYYGGKQYQSQLDPQHKYFVSFIQAGHTGTCGINIRFTQNPTPTGWQQANTIQADTTLNKKHIIVIDYQTVDTTTLNFYSTWTVDPLNKIPTGNITSNHQLNANQRTTQEYTYTGNIAHISTGHHTTQNSITIHNMYYAIAQTATTPPTHGAWGPQQTQN